MRFVRFQSAAKLSRKNNSEHKKRNPRQCPRVEKTEKQTFQLIPTFPSEPDASWPRPVPAPSVFFAKGESDWFAWKTFPKRPHSFAVSIFVSNLDFLCFVLRHPFRLPDIDDRFCHEYAVGIDSHYLLERKERGKGGQHSWLRLSGGIRWRRTTVWRLKLIFEFLCAGSRRNVSEIDEAALDGAMDFSSRARISSFRRPSKLNRQLIRRIEFDRCTDLC